MRHVSCDGCGKGILPGSVYIQVVRIRDSGRRSGAEFHHECVELSNVVPGDLGDKIDLSMEKCH